MKLFKHREVKEAIAYALAGGQALHVWNPTDEERRRAPIAFRARGPWAHLLDQNLDRLVQTAKRLGVKTIKVGKEGHRHQHIDLCAGPLCRALLEIEPCDEETRSGCGARAKGDRKRGAKK